MIPEIRERLDEIHSMMNEISHCKLTIMVKEYDLAEWITLTDYSKKYNLSISRVQQWIIRGVVPSNCVIVVPELNYLKLLKTRCITPGPIKKQCPKIHRKCSLISNQRAFSLK